MGKPRTAGVVAVRRDRATGDTHVLFVSLRWTRSGFKTLMHCLNGAEKATRGAGATKNCTDEELAFFLGEGDDGAAERLWNRFHQRSTARPFHSSSTEWYLLPLRYVVSI